MMDTKTTKITITKTDGGVGVLSKEENGQWGITLNGRDGGSMYYDTEQVERIAAKAVAAGDKVEIN